MIDTIYNTVIAISNKEQRGSVSPEKFNYLANLAVYDIYNSYDIGKFINRANRGYTTRGLGDDVKMERERYQHFFKYDIMNLTNGAYLLPTDCNYLDSVSYAGIEVEECLTTREFNLLKRSTDFQASLDYPIYLRLRDELEVFPLEIIGELELYYVRKPIAPKWTYTIVNGVALFDPSASDYSDIDLHSAEQSNVILNILSQMGINLKEPDLEKYAESLKDKNIQQENTI